MDSEKIENQRIILDGIDIVLDDAFKEYSNFNIAFNGTEPIKFKSFQSETEYSFEPSAVLFRLDRDAYFEEMNIWDNNTSQKLHKEVVDHLKKDGRITIFSELVLSIKRKKIAPFVGAGLCVPLNLPLWSNALREITGRIYIRKMPKIEKLINDFKFLEAAEILYKKDKRAFTSVLTN